jgi:aldehyde:ferredoxin oxidoreductase
LKPVRGKHLDRKKYEKMLDEYYELHGWDSDGMPTPETLKKLELDKEPSHLV